MIANDPTAAFRVEAGELLDQIEEALLDLGHRLDDHDLIDQVFRGLHTLKGSGAMFGFDALAGFTHHCESAFDRVRKRLAPATAELVAVILSAQDHMRALLDGGAAVPDSVGAEILERLQAAIDGAPAVSDQAEPARRGWRLTFRLPPESMANGSNPLMLLDELRDLGDARIVALTDRIPPIGELVPTECHIGWAVELYGDIRRSDIEDVFIFVMDDMQLEIEELAEQGEAEASVQPCAPAVPIDHAPHAVSPVPSAARALPTATTEEPGKALPKAG